MWGLEIRQYHLSLWKFTQQALSQKKVFMKLWENLSRIFQALLQKLFHGISR